MDKFFDQLKRLVSAVAILGLVIAPLPERTIETAQAADLTSVKWTVADPAATSTTYTHEFTAPAAWTRAEIELRQPPGPPQPMPDFGKASLNTASGQTTSGISSTYSFFPAGVGSMVVSLATTGSAIPAGAVKIVFKDVPNPSQAGVWETNTVLTGSTGTEVGGQRGAATNGKLKVGGTPTLTVTVKDKATGAAIKGVRMEVHSEFGPGAGGVGVFQVGTTDASGVVEFYVEGSGLVVEQSPGFDPNSSDASTLAQYLRPEPVRNVTLSKSSPKTQTVELSKTTKKITGTVTKEDTGAAVANANVNAMSFGPGGFSFAQTDSSGKYTLNVGCNTQGDAKDRGCNFMVMVFPGFGGPPGADGKPKQQGDFFPDSPKQISFNLPATEAETVTHNLKVKTADATVKGKLVDSNGVAVQGGGMGAANFRSHTFLPVFINQDGTFSFKALSGTGDWELHYFDPNAKGAMPNVKFTVKKGDNDLGTIKLLALDKTITITAKRIDKTPAEGIPDIPVMIFSKAPGQPPAFGFTNSSGVATVKVFSGFEGRAMAMPGGSGGPGKRDGPGGSKPGEGIHSLAAQDSVKVLDSSDVDRLFPVDGSKLVKAGESAVLNFAKADKTVNVSTVEVLADGTKKIFSDGGFAHFRPASATGFEGHMAGFFGPTAGGRGQIFTTKGKFKANVFFGPESDAIATETDVEVGDSGATAEITVARKTVTVTGDVKDAASGAVIKNASLEIMVGAFSDGVFSPGSYNPTTGKYKVFITKNRDWRVGVTAGDEKVGKDGYVSNINPKAVKGTKDGESITFDVTLAKVDSSFEVTVVDQDGKSIGEGVAVFADTGLAEIGGPGPGPGGPPVGPEDHDFGFSGVTNDKGVATINVAADEYSLVVNARDQNLFQTTAVKKKIGANATEKVTLTLAKANSTVTIDGGTGVSGGELALFNKNGTIAFSVEDDDDGKVDGKFTAQVPAGDYVGKVGLDKPEENKVIESEFKAITAVAGQTVSDTLTTTTQDGVLPKPISAEVSSSTVTAVSMTHKGVEEVAINLPAGAFETNSQGGGEGSGEQSGSTTVTATPLDAQAVSTKADAPIEGVSLTALDSSGNEVTTITGVATAKIHYDPTKLPAGVKESDLIVKAFNEDSGQWGAVDSASVNVDKDIVEFTTSHFTDFAIVAAADTIAPAEAKDPKATGGKTKVTLAWTNPTDSDFDHLDIYRSEDTKSIGSKVKTTAKADTSYEDTGLTNDKAYYYTFKSVDTTGNVSAGTDQVTGIPTASTSATVKTLPKTGMAGATANNQLPTSNGWYGLVGFMLIAAVIGLKGRKGLKGING